MVAIEELASSRIRLKIANLLSSRPATLSEMSELTGISVQGVLKHLKKVRDEGLLTENNMKSGKYLRQRKLYFMRGRKVADYSEGDLLVASVGMSTDDLVRRVGDVYDELDWLAQDIVILRRRARELSHRMRRVLDEVTEDEARISGLVDGLPLADDEKQIAYLIFTEDTPERARAILKDHYGCRDPEAGLAAVAAKIREGRM
ncbi:MAG: ArsR family transcriptional regulator [Nitrososphaerota archaeon]|nr:ArsR family transcriptional regulator [Nitrososphaerota archaeon]